VILKFGLKDRDAAGRIGEIKINNKKIETPVLLPVINPNLDYNWILNEFKVDAFITNAYILYKKHKEDVEKKGIHKFFNFEGLIVTDSGSFQLMNYGDIDVNNKEIVEFQEKIGVDIGTFLDIPTKPDKTYEEALRDLEITISRGIEALNIRKKIALNGTIQGGIYKDLREKAAYEFSKLDFDVHPIGGIVPLMINYDFETLVRVFMWARVNLPSNRPVHAFGAGHPLIMPLLVALGTDIFDSASYSLFAKEKRYITPFRTLNLDKMNYLPCNCPVCSRYSLKEVKESTRLIEMHNLYVLFEEIKRIKEYIKEGWLWEYVIIKAHSNPSLYRATRWVLENFQKYLQEKDPIRKRSGIFWQGDWTELRPEILRAKKRLKERLNREDVPEELRETFPFGQMVK
jgi:7-cyano-7-deazaguanine tRNA-ribosyltransferase